MRLYHKLHRRQNAGQRPTLIRNCGQRIAKIIKKNPSTHREIFEEIFQTRRMAEDFHGLEVSIVGKTRLPNGAEGYLIEHPWFSPKGSKRRRQIAVGVCSARRAREIGTVPVKELSSLHSYKRPEGALMEEVEEFCCLGEAPEKPRPGQRYKNGILLCAGRPYGGEVAIGVGRRPDVDKTLQELYKELEKLSDKELGLLDTELGRGRTRPGPITKAREKFMASDPLSAESPKLKKRWEDLRARLFDIQSRKKRVQEEIRKSTVQRPEAVKHGKRGGGGYARALTGQGPLHEEYILAGGGATTGRALAFRYGEEEAARLGAQEREFREEHLLKTGGMLRRMGKGKRIPFNERFLFEDTPIIGVIWEKGAIDPLTGLQVGDKSKLKWQIFDGAGKLIDEGLASKRTDAARVMKLAIRRATSSGKVGPGKIEARTIQESIITQRSAPSLVLGEHLIAQFIPQEKVRITKADYAGANFRDIMHWGIPSPYGLVEFFRDRGGYHVTLKLPSGQKHSATTLFKHMDEAVEYSMIMMQNLTDINKWLVEEGPRWSEPREKRVRRRRNPGKYKAIRNPDLYETMKDLLAPPFVSRPKRKRESITATGVPKVGQHFRKIAQKLYGKEAFDFGFTFGVLRGIDTCGLKDVTERRRIRRYIEQQVIDAVHSLSVEAPKRREENPRKPKWKPNWNPKKNPDPIEALKDIVAPPFITRAKRKQQSITVAELPDLKEHFVQLAWSLNGQAAYDFGFVFGVLRGIDTCGLMRVGERRRIRRRIEQELMDAAYGLAVEVPGSGRE